MSLHYDIAGNNFETYCRYYKNEKRGRVFLLLDLAF